MNLPRSLTFPLALKNKTFPFVSFQAYMQVNRRRQPMVALAKLLSILADLRSLGNNNSRQCFDLKLVANRKLPQFLAEIWDIV